jgi:Protein of unknown function (DUF3800)
LTASHKLRRHFRKAYGLPVQTEFHTRPFLVNKNPYRAFGISDADRLQAVDEYCELIAGIDVRILNVCVVKPRIKSATYTVLDWAMKFSIQRLENDMRSTGGADARFLMVTDPGRVGKMRKTTRKVQRINYIPSMFGPYSYRREVERMIEDPLPKDSRESYFIQTADLISYIVYLHTVFSTGIGTVHGRMPPAVNRLRVVAWLDALKPVLNLKASGTDPYGIYYHPQR